MDGRKSTGSLKERMGQAVKSSAPSMNPFDTPPPTVKKEAEVLPDMREVIEDAGMRRALVPLIEQNAELASEERLIRKQRKPLQDGIKKLLGNNYTRFMCGLTRVVYYQVPRESLSRQKLLEAGVSPKILAACTVTSYSATLKITPSGDGEDDES